MTEADWLSAIDPGPMLGFLRGKAGERKTRLFAVSCCRYLQPLVTGEGYSQAVDASESYADGLSTKAALKRARQAVRKVRHWLETTRENGTSEWVALWLAEVAASENAYHSVGVELQRLSALGLIEIGQRPPECDLLRCIFGNPFRIAAVDPAWLTASVVSLAQAIYDDRGSDDMPILGDALEEAGCDSPEVLDHCRAPTVHGRGCWVLDAVLGKA